MKRTAIVVPCFNEAGRIPLDAFRAYAAGDPTVEFVLVDDGSTDSTLSELQGLADADPGGFRVIHHEPNRGKAEAVRRGVLDALGRGAELVGYWDADLATPLDEVPRFVGFLEEHPACQVVLGARVLLLGRSIDRHPIRHYAGRIIATAASQALRLPVYDTQCGAKLFRASDAVRAAFETPFSTGWTFDVELLARLVQGLGEPGTGLPQEAIWEIPLLRWHDVPGSKVRSRDFFKALVEILRIHLHYVRRSAH